MCEKTHSDGFCRPLREEAWKKKLKGKKVSFVPFEDSPPLNLALWASVFLVAEKAGAEEPIPCCVHT